MDFPGVLKKKTWEFQGQLKKRNFLECSRKTHVELGLGGNQKKFWFGSFKVFQIS